jgi:predicted permease
MSDWRPRLERELAGLPLPPGRQGDLVEELAQDLEERARVARLRGASEEEAALEAWRGLGSLEELRARLLRVEGESRARSRAREEIVGRETRSSVLSGLGQDIRLAGRSLFRSPGFTTVALLTLALGLGANVTLFSVVNAVFLAPLPVADPERVVMVYTSDFSGPRYGASSYPDFEDLRAEPQLFESLAAFGLEATALTTDREPARVWCELVTGGFFPALDVRMTLGRPLGEDDDREAAPPAAVISEGLWRRLGADPSVLGRTLTLSGTAFTVVGVAAEPFTGLSRGVAAEAWLPLVHRSRLVPGNDALRNRGSRFLSLVGRLPRGVSAADLQPRLDVLASRLRASYPEQWKDRSEATRRLSLLREYEARIPPAAKGAVLGFAALLVVIVGVVLAIAGTNVANLMLARAATRRREIAVRLALGASGGRVVRQFLTESVLMASLGGLLGLLLAAWASQALRGFTPPFPVPMHLEVVVDGRVLLFAFGLTLATGLLLGLAPALQAGRPELVPALKDEGGGVATGSRGRRLRRAFVVAQVALSMVLLVGASLLLRGLARATRLAPGFDVESAQLVPVDLGLAGYDAARAAALVDGLAERGPSLPGVKAVALDVTMPLDLHVSRRKTLVEGHVPQAGEDMEHYFAVVGPGHFEAFRIPILRGRGFTPEDRADAPGVVIVNETFASRFWPGVDPIGRTMRLRGEDGPPLTVVGLARDSKYRTLAEEPTPFYYLPLLQDYAFVSRYTRLFPAHVVVQGNGDPGAMTRAVAGVLRDLDPKLPAYPPKPMLEHLGLSVLPSRVASVLFAAFGLLGLLLASLGVYGVVAYSVAQRTQEMGVRIALGATGRDVLGLVLKDGVALTAAGVAAGTVLAAALAPAMRRLLYGLSPLDPVTFLGVGALLVLVALVASTFPARRAARVDPVVALRYE